MHNEDTEELLKRIFGEHAKPGVTESSAKSVDPLKDPEGTKPNQTPDAAFKKGNKSGIGNIKACIVRL